MNLVGRSCARRYPVILGIRQGAAAMLLSAASLAPLAAEPIRPITVDGLFDDWATVPAYSDPADDQHDTDHDGMSDVPSYVNHPDVDILEYKVAHDADNLYAYFRARGSVGATQSQSAGRAGRYYVIVTIDVDNDDSTGYWLHEGGYYPTSRGYDMNMEIEFYDGAFNTGHYINHGALSAGDLATLTADQKQGVVDVLPGTYEHYTQWVMFDDANQGEFDLGDGTSITFVADRGPVYQGILRGAMSADGHEFEMVAPFAGFMNYPGAAPGDRGAPIMSLGRTIDISFSLEASGELHAPPGGNGAWASDTATPIIGYRLAVPEPLGLALTWVLFPGLWLARRRI
ncbi:MAG: hypothetical protein IT424_07935 [Pirellulales bacterium]|nr:hypothetical protein [Pirellulales bacterium]